ncbi:hypothetical protein XENTR_v10011467 [Xenopus tropicalis]|nr:hypothetical protein XENTR_v10011467 [Xenopus tropicalis]
MYCPIVQYNIYCIILQIHQYPFITSPTLSNCTVLCQQKSSQGTRTCNEPVILLLPEASVHLDAKHFSSLF